jgi:hypothetical protein
MSEGIVYVIRYGESDRYKIGRTVQLAARLSGLQGASPDPLTVVYSVEHAHHEALERALHRHFDTCRLSREWFRLTRHDLEGVQAFVETFTPGPPPQRTPWTEKRPPRDPDTPWTLAQAMDWYPYGWLDSHPRRQKRLMQMAKLLLIQLSVYTITNTDGVLSATSEVVNPDWVKLARSIGASKPEWLQEVLTYLVDSGALVAYRQQGQMCYRFPEPGYQYGLPEES